MTASCTGEWLATGVSLGLPMGSASAAWGDWCAGQFWAAACGWGSRLAVSSAVRFQMKANFLTETTLFRSATKATKFRHFGEISDEIRNPGEARQAGATATVARLAGATAAGLWDGTTRAASKRGSDAAGSPPASSLLASSLQVAHQHLPLEDAMKVILRFSKSFSDLFEI